MADSVRGIGRVKCIALFSCAAAALLSSSTTVTAQVPSAAVMNLAKRSIARVRARNCGVNPERVATGFLWRDNITLVTARHVIAGCSSISVIFPATGQSFRAFPSRQLRSQDLASLRLEQATGLPPLEIRETLPGVGSKIAAIGFALGAPTADSKLLDVTLANTPPGSKLADMLPDSFRNLLERSGELDVNTGILRLDGNLLPGLSGAPLLAADGRVVGIGSGGLQNGAGGLVWAVRASYLSALAAQPTTSAVAPPIRTSGLAFAYQPEQGSVSSVACGDLSFNKSRSVSLSSLYDGSDDRLGLQQLTSGMGIKQQELPSIIFDIWIDSDSGASVALPQGVVLRQSGEKCIASLTNGIEMVVRGFKVDGDTVPTRQQSVQFASLTFEQSLAKTFNSILAPDLGFTYLSPIFRPDGFVVRRAGYTLTRPTQNWGVLESDYVFTTHMSRGNRYIGIATTRRNFLLDNNAMQTCAQAPQGAPCLSVQKPFRVWANSVLAVHLGTMPPI